MYTSHLGYEIYLRLHFAITFFFIVEIFEIVVVVELNACFPSRPYASVRVRAWPDPFKIKFHLFNSCMLHLVAILLHFVLFSCKLSFTPTTDIRSHFHSRQTPVFAMIMSFFYSSTQARSFKSLVLR